MLSYSHFTHDERICLHNLVREGLSIRQIACRLGRSPSTISREARKPSNRNKEEGDGAFALSPYR